MGKFRIKNTSGQYWTGSCWGVIQAAETYDRGLLFNLYIDEDCNPETFFSHTLYDVGWSSEDGDGFAIAELVR